MDSEHNDFIEDPVDIKVEKKNYPDSKKVLSIFNSYIDENKTYSLDEYKKLIVLSYKETLKKNKKTSSSLKDEPRIKREPTIYNIFIREEMQKLKEQNKDIPYKELMKLAAKKWNDQKPIEL